MRICFLGNSHLACVKKAWDSEAHAYPDIQVRFFASKGTTITNTAVSGRSIVATSPQVKESFRQTSRGFEAVVPDDYDVVVLYGFGLSLGRTLKQRLTLGKQPLASSALRDRATIFNTPSSSHVYGLCERLPARRWLACLCPNIAGEAAGGSDAPHDLGDRYGKACDQLLPLFRQFGLTCSPQPLETLASIDETGARFNVDGYGLGETPKSDGYQKIAVDKTKTHMNEEFGAIVLRDVIASAMAA